MNFLLLSEKIQLISDESKLSHETLSAKYELDIPTVVQTILDKDELLEQYRNLLKITAKQSTVCLLCKTNYNDKLSLGELVKCDDVLVHLYCLLFADGLTIFNNFWPEKIVISHDEIASEAFRACLHVCSYCLKNGASVTCCVDDCNAEFHLACGIVNQSMHQFFGTYRSFCVLHRPQQFKSEPFSHEVTVNCVYCSGSIDRSNCFSALKSPCCSSTWFHRSCVQKKALKEMTLLQCPNCDDEMSFSREMLKFGICLHFQNCGNFCRDELEKDTSYLKDKAQEQCVPNAEKPSSQCFYFCKENGTQFTLPLSRGFVSSAASADALSLSELLKEEYSNNQSTDETDDHFSYHNPKSFQDVQDGDAACKKYELLMMDSQKLLEEISSMNETMKSGDCSETEALGGPELNDDDGSNSNKEFPADAICNDEVKSQGAMESVEPNNHIKSKYSSNEIESDKANKRSSIECDGKRNLKKGFPADETESDSSDEIGSDESLEEIESDKTSGEIDSNQTGEDSTEESNANLLLNESTNVTNAIVEGSERNNIVELKNDFKSSNDVQGQSVKPHFEHSYTKKMDTDTSFNTSAEHSRNAILDDSSLNLKDETVTSHSTVESGKDDTGLDAECLHMKDMVKIRGSDECAKHCEIIKSSNEINACGEGDIKVTNEIVKCLNDSENRLMIENFVDVESEIVSESSNVKNVQHELTEPKTELQELDARTQAVHMDHSYVPNENLVGIVMKLSTGSKPNSRQSSCSREIRSETSQLVMADDTLSKAIDCIDNDSEDNQMKLLIDQVELSAESIEFSNSDNSSPDTNSSVHGWASFSKKRKVFNGFSEYAKHREIIKSSHENNTCVEGDIDVRNEIVEFSNDSESRLLIENSVIVESEIVSVSSNVSKVLRLEPETELQELDARTPAMHMEHSYMSNTNLVDLVMIPSTVPKPTRRQPSCSRKTSSKVSHLVMADDKLSEALDCSNNDSGTSVKFVDNQIKPLIDQAELSTGKIDQLGDETPNGLQMQDLSNGLNSSPDANNSVNGGASFSKKRKMLNGFQEVAKQREFIKSSKEINTCVEGDINVSNEFVEFSTDSENRILIENSIVKNQRNALQLEPAEPKTERQDLDAGTRALKMEHLDGQSSRSKKTKSETSHLVMAGGNLSKAIDCSDSDSDASASSDDNQMKLIIDQGEISAKETYKTQNGLKFSNAVKSIPDTDSSVHGWASFSKKRKELNAVNKFAKQRQIIKSSNDVDTCVKDDIDAGKKIIEFSNDSKNRILIENYVVTKNEIDLKCSNVRKVPQVESAVSNTELQRLDARPQNLNMEHLSNEQDVMDIVTKSPTSPKPNDGLSNSSRKAKSKTSHLVLADDKLSKANHRIDMDSDASISSDDNQIKLIIDQEEVSNKKSYQAGDKPPSGLRLKNVGFSNAAGSSPDKSNSIHDWDSFSKQWKQLNGVRERAPYPRRKRRNQPIIMHWLLYSLDHQNYQGLRWLPNMPGYYCISWPRISTTSSGWHLFIDYAVLKGENRPISAPLLKTWKRNFRCALNKCSSMDKITVQGMERYSRVFFLKNLQELRKEMHDRTFDYSQIIPNTGFLKLGFEAHSEDNIEILKSCLHKSANQERERKKGHDDSHDLLDLSAAQMIYQNNTAKVP